MSSIDAASAAWMDACSADDAVRARAFSLAAHGEQRYGDQPYSVHIDAVAALAATAAPAGHAAQVIAYLHDVAEDTAVALTDIAANFGPDVAACVALLTDGQGTRAERKAASHRKLAATPDAYRIALLVKTADRLANVRACVAADRRDKLAIYAAEHNAFRHAAHRAGLRDALWSELDELLGAALSG